MNDIIFIANTFLPFVIMAAIFYFMLWRPQKQEQKRRKEMLDSLKRGDKIITIGGMYGTLTKVGPVKVKVRLAEGVEIEFARTAISGVQDAGADAQPQPETLDA
jgi:preprotein translocase subunit YajC